MVQRTPLDAFLRGMSDRRRDEAAPFLDDLARFLLRWLDEARARWPGVVVSPDTFATYVAERIGEGPSLTDVMTGLRGAELYIACACTNGDARALRLFEDEYLAQVDFAWQRIRGHGLQREDARQLV